MLSILFEVPELPMVMMGIFGSLFGGKSESKVQIPAYIQSSHTDAIDRATQLADIGYMPYMGPQVAALNPGHMASYQGMDALAQAYGMPSGLMNSAAAMPPPTDYGGYSGYSSYPLFSDALERFRAAYPEQAAAYDGMFIDPVAPPPVQQQAVAPPPSNGPLVPGTKAWDEWSRDAK